MSAGLSQGAVECLTGIGPWVQSLELGWRKGRESKEGEEEGRGGPEVRAASHLAPDWFLIKSQNSRFCE